MDGPLAHDCKTGVMICGHGSRARAAMDEFEALVAQLPPHLPHGWEIAHGYLEFANPVLRDGLDTLRAKGCTRILAVPGILFAAMHSKNDMPSVLRTYAHQHGIDVHYGRELGVDARMIRAAAARIKAVLDDRVPRDQTCLVVIGRGASDPDANGNVAKVARMLHEGLGTGWLEVGYSGVTFPLVEPCLQHAARLGYRRIVVFPYFLFTGVLIDRIYGFTDRVAAAHPDIEFVKAGYLNDHPLVLETFAERAMEQVGEIPPPNCAMCKYRTQVLGFEAEVGMAQHSHHHHVEGQGANAPGARVSECALCDTFCTGACRLDGVDGTLDGPSQGGGGHGHDHGHSHDHGHAHGHDNHTDGHTHGGHHSPADDHGHAHRHGHGHDNSHSHGHKHTAAAVAAGLADMHDNSHGHGHTHGHHHHPPYPHMRHPHGPESARKFLKENNKR